MKILACNENFVFLECNLCNGGTKQIARGCPQCYGMDFTKIRVSDVRLQEFSRPTDERFDKAVVGAGGRVIAPGVYAFKTAFSKDNSCD